jgi:glucan phosphoethanolaminetransferase (alkaline phosphatase superfamily)
MLRLRRYFDSRRGRRRLRRFLGLLTLLAPFLWILENDVARRARQIASFDSAHRWGYAATAAGSLVFWALPLYVAARRRGLVRWIGAALFATLFTLTNGVQQATYAIYRMYISIDGLQPTESIPDGLVASLALGRPRVLLFFLLNGAVAIGLVVLARRWVRPRRVPHVIAALLLPAPLVGATLLPVSYRQIQSSTPDSIYFHGVTAMVKERLGVTTSSKFAVMQRRHSAAVQPISPKPARPRNVLLILQESQRADVTCIDFEPRCENATRKSNSAAPGRMGFSQMRSMGSSTAISMMTLWSGLRVNETREAVQTAPFIWDYAHAAGYDTAYWTSQHLMFSNLRLFVQDQPLSLFVSATNLDPMADMFIGAEDAKLTDRVIQDWGKLREPFLAVVHYSNIHAPRLYDGKNAPFRPADRRKRNETPEWQNYYKNVVYLSDIAVGRLLQHIRKTDSGQRTVVVYTSDHGESYHEHRQGCDHSCTLFDEEIKVPAWVDAPAGTLTQEEEASLRGAHDALLWHVDVAPTLLDLLGVWDAPELASFRQRMAGRPMTRPLPEAPPYLLSNNSWVWEYRLFNWGVMHGSKKLFALPGDRKFRCFDVHEDPQEKNNLGEAGCSDLAERARAAFGGLPRAFAPLRERGGFPQ